IVTLMQNPYGTPASGLFAPNTQIKITNAVPRLAAQFIPLILASKPQQIKPDTSKIITEVQNFQNHLRTSVPPLMAVDMQLQPIQEERPKSPRQLDQRFQSPIKQSGRSSSALSNSERRISSSPSNVASQILLLPSINIPGINQNIQNNKIDAQIYFQVVQASQSQQQTLLGLWCICASSVSVNNSKQKQPLLFIGQLEETSTSRDKKTEKRTFLLFSDTFGTFMMRIISSDAFNEIKCRFCIKKEKQSVIGGSSIEIGNVIAIGASSQKQQDVTKQQYEKFVSVPY
ncbi:MAG: hypothetical protein EZS28_052605, partial [Streblomastix strix]